MVVNVLLPEVTFAVGMIRAWRNVGLRVEPVSDRRAGLKDIAKRIFMRRLSLPL